MPFASHNFRQSNPKHTKDRFLDSTNFTHDENESSSPQPHCDRIFRLLIVDRDSMSSDLLVNALTQENRCEAVQVQPLELLRVLATSKIDLAVISSEVQTETGNGYDLAHTVSRKYPNLGIVILLHLTTRESVVKAFRSGARGVFSRQQSMTEFFDCVEHVRKGHIWAGKQETDSLVEAFRSIPTFDLISSNDSAALTARETQVVHCAAKGKTNRAIASELSLSEHTVKNYLFRAFEKLGVSSRVELLFYLNLQEQSLNVDRGEELSVSQNTA